MCGRTQLARSDVVGASERGLRARTNEALEPSSLLQLLLRDAEQDDSALSTRAETPLGSIVPASMRW